MPTQPNASTLVLDALAEHDGFSLGEAGPTVYEFVDPDTLDALFEHTRSPSMSLHLEIDGVTVTVWKSGEDICVYVTDRESETDET